MKCNCSTISLEETSKITAKYKEKKGSLIKILQQIQKHYGYIPKEAIERVSKDTKIPESVIFGVVTFYSQFRLTPAGEHLIRVCHGTACHVSGAKEITETIEKILNIKDGETTKDNKFTLESVACLGCCSLAPVMTIDETTYGKLDAKKVKEILNNVCKEEK